MLGSSLRYSARSLAKADVLISSVVDARGCVRLVPTAVAALVCLNQERPWPFLAYRRRLGQVALNTESSAPDASIGLYLGYPPYPRTIGNRLTDPPIFGFDPLIDPRIAKALDVVEHISSRYSRRLIPTAVDTRSLSMPKNPRLSQYTHSGRRRLCARSADGLRETSDTRGG